MFSNSLTPCVNPTSEAVENHHRECGGTGAHPAPRRTGGHHDMGHLEVVDQTSPRPCLQSPDRHFRPGCRVLVQYRRRLLRKALDDAEMSANDNSNATFRLFCGGTSPVPLTGQSAGLARLIGKSPSVDPSSLCSPMTPSASETNEYHHGYHGHPLLRAGYLRIACISKVSEGVSQSRGRRKVKIILMSTQATGIRWLDGGDFTST